jgi:hypothetical protein
MFKKGSFVSASSPYYKTEKPPLGKSKRGFAVIDFAYTLWAQAPVYFVAKPPYGLALRVDN